MWEGKGIHSSGSFIFTFRIVMTLRFKILPEAAFTPATPPQRFQVEVIYATSNPDKEPDDDDPEEISQSVRVPLDEKQLTGEAIIEDVTQTAFRARLMRADGTVVLVKEMAADAGGEAELKLSAADVTLLQDTSRKQIVDEQPDFTLARRALRLIPTTEVVPDFAQARAMVSVVKKIDDLRISDAGKLLGLIGNTQKATALEITGDGLGVVSDVVWESARLSGDGVIESEFEASEAQGWLWWISGSHQIIGFVTDALKKGGSRSFAVALPALRPVKTKETAHGAGGECESCAKRSNDYSERELTEHPERFAEDPGSTCRPFSNPERILGEKSFSVIARVDTPEIGARSSLRTRSLKVLDLDSLGSAPPPPPSGFFASFARFLGAASAAIPKVSPLKRKLLLPPSVVNHLRSLSSERHPVSSEHPVQWEDDISQYQACSVALGHVLEYRVRSRASGYSLGTVSSTLTLAARQTKRIQKIEWSRSERATRDEKTRLTDEVNDSVFRERDYQDEVAASLSEWSSGSSSAVTAGVAGGAGFAGPGVLGGVGGGVGAAASSATQNGGRRTAANEAQRLRDAIRRHGDATRKFGSTVVQEVTQEENVTGTTEVLRNPNYAHSITVIYYQILRHLQVSTEFAGARECLYVPFAVKPFDLDRAYRWRESIQRNLRSPRHLKALRWLKDVRENFASSDLPAGLRSQQRITSLRGSIFLKLAIERPEDKADGSFDDAQWSVLRRFLPGPAKAVFDALGRSARSRDEAFQKEHAPSIAANWCNHLSLVVLGTEITADFTLATRYEAGRTVRVDFTVDPSSLGSLKRSNLQNLGVISGKKLNAGSIANLTGMSLTYTTAHFERSEQARTGVNDLIDPDTGNTDRAQVSFPLDAWDNVDERAEIKRAVRDLVDHLNEHVEYYHKAIWWSMDRDRLLMLLDGFLVPGSRDVSIATVVDREPLAIIGNCLVYRVGAGTYIGCERAKTPDALHELYHDNQPLRDPLRLSLPTDGLYARTIMDECPALEDHYGNKDWVVTQPDPDLGNIDPFLLGSRRASTDEALKSTTLPSTIINLQNAPDAPQPAGLRDALGNVGGAFRDMTGLAANQANARAALDTAAGLANSFGSQAAAIELAKTAHSQEATRSAPQKLAATHDALAKKLITPEQAQVIATAALTEMNGGSLPAASPHQNKAITSAIQSAGNLPGSTIEATTPEGTVKVNLGGKTETSGFQQIKGGFPTKSGAETQRDKLPENLRGATDASVQARQRIAAAIDAGEAPETAVSRVIKETFDRDLLPLLEKARTSDSDLDQAIRLTMDLEAMRQSVGLDAGESPLSRANSKIALAWSAARSRVVQQIIATGALAPLRRGTELIAIAQTLGSTSIQGIIPARETDPDELLRDAGIQLTWQLTGPAQLDGGATFELTGKATLQIGSNPPVPMVDASAHFFCGESLEEEVSVQTDATGSAKASFRHRLPPGSGGPAASLNFGSPDVICSASISHKDFPIIIGNQSLVIPGKLQITHTGAFRIADGGNALTGSVVTVPASGGEVVLEFTITSAGVPPQTSLPVQFNLNGGGRLTNATNSNSSREGFVTAVYEAPPQAGNARLQMDVVHPDGRSAVAMVSIQIV